MHVIIIIIIILSSDHRPETTVVLCHMDAVIIIIVRPHCSSTYVDAAYCYRLSRVVCRSVCHSSEPCKTAELTQMMFGIWTLVGPRKHVFGGGAHWRNLANTIEPSVCGGDVACCQITLTTWPVVEMVHRLATIDMGRKMGVCCSLFHWGAGSHLTQCCLGRGLPPYQEASWSIQPFGHNTSTLQTEQRSRPVA